MSKKEVSYTIISKPDYISFECPFCKEKQEISVAEFNENVFELYSCECPSCGKEVDLGDWDYD